MSKTMGFMQISFLILWSTRVYNMLDSTQVIFIQCTLTMELEKWIFHIIGLAPSEVSCHFQEVNINDLNYLPLGSFLPYSVRETRLGELCC